MTLPTNLDLHLLINMSLILFNTQHAYGIANALNFWYNYFDMIPEVERKDYSKIILKYFFFELFLHWSKNVREIFYKFICYRLLYWFEISEDTSIEKIVASINRNLATIDKYGNVYQQEVFKWEQATQQRKKRLSFNQLLKVLKRKVDQSGFGIDDGKNYLQSVKFGKTFESRNRRKMSGTSEIQHNTSYIISIPDELPKAKKTREYKKTKKRLTRIETDNFVYCKKSIEEFEKDLEQYKQDLPTLQGDVKARLPRLAFRLPIDKYELMENDNKGE